MPGFLWHSSKWVRRFGCLLQYMPGLEVSACSLKTNLNYVTSMLHLHLSLNHKVKLWQLLGGTCSNFRGAFSWIDTIVYIGVSTQFPPPLCLSCQASLKSTNCPSLPFLGNPPSILVFHRKKISMQNKLNDVHTFPDRMKSAFRACSEGKLSWLHFHLASNKAHL